MKNVDGNGGEWTMSMPEGIQNGGVGKNHWTSRQARIESGQEAKKGKF